MYARKKIKYVIRTKVIIKEVRIFYLNVKVNRKSKKKRTHYKDFRVYKKLLRLKKPTR